MPEGTEDHTDEREQFTTLEKENAPTLASDFDEPGGQDDLPPPSQNTNLAQPSVTGLQVGPSVKNKQKHGTTHECVSEK